MVDFQKLGNGQNFIENPAPEGLENQELGNDKNPANRETIENEELGKPPYIYKEEDCQVEATTLKFRSKPCGKRKEKHLKKS